MSAADRKPFYCYALLEFQREVWGGDLSSSELECPTDLDKLLTNAACGVLSKMAEHAANGDPVLVTLWINVGRMEVSQRAREALRMFGAVATPDFGGFHWSREGDEEQEGGHRG